MDLALKNIFENGASVITEYALTDNGVNVSVSGDCEVAYMLPAFDFDGRTKTEINELGNKLEISYHGWKCVYTASSPISALDGIGCNRNGHYKPYYAKAENNLSITIEIELI